MGSLKKVDNVREVCRVYYSNDLAIALTYLHDFAPTEKKKILWQKYQEYLKLNVW